MYFSSLQRLIKIAEMLRIPLHCATLLPFIFIKEMFPFQAVRSLVLAHDEWNVLISSGVRN